MTMITEIYRIKEEGTYASLGEFLSDGEFSDVFCARHNITDINDDDFWDNIQSSDYEEIEACLQADDRIFSLDVFEDSGYTYFLVREWEKVE